MKLVCILLMLLMNINSTPKNINDDMHISYFFDNYELKIEKPDWWDSISFGEKLDQANCKNIQMRMSSPEKWRHSFKAYFLCGQLHDEVPYQLIHIARAAGDYGLAIKVKLALIDYLKKSDIANLSWNHSYKTLGDDYLEVGNLRLAKKYYKKAIPVKNDKVHSQTYYAEQAKVALQQLKLIDDKKAYFAKRNQFKETLNQRITQLSSNSTLIQNKKQALEGFLWSIETKDLTVLQLAFLDILKEDLSSNESKVLTPELKAEITKTLSDHHLGEFTEFEIRPGGIIFPTDINNKWSLSFDGKDFEEVGVNFNRWEVISVSLSSSRN